MHGVPAETMVNVEVVGFPTSSMLPVVSIVVPFFG